MMGEVANPWTELATLRRQLAQKQDRIEELLTASESVEVARADAAALRSQLAERDAAFSNHGLYAVQVFPGNGPTCIKQITSTGLNDVGDAEVLRRWLKCTLAVGSERDAEIERLKRRVVEPEKCLRDYHVPKAQYSLARQEIERLTERAKADAIEIERLKAEVERLRAASSPSG